MQFQQSQRPIVRQQRRLAQKELLLCPTCKAKVEVVGGKMINADTGKAHICPPHPTMKREVLIVEARPLVVKVVPLTFKREPLVFLAKTLGKQGK